MSLSIHIVRRYGSVGGMEHYVFELTHALAAKGQEVIVLCEELHLNQSQQRQLPTALRTVELGNRLRKPRWLAQWFFSRRVSCYLKQHSFPDAIIHSHERTAVHHVTTFHGPPFLQRKKRILDFLSPRIHMWSYLEKRELLGKQVKAILPNSLLIAEQLTQYYPDAATNIRRPAYPGVSTHYSSLQRKPFSHTIGFLGREWRRKGLDLASQIVAQLRQQYPQVRFVIAGCDPEDVAALFSKKEWPEDSYELAGWVDTTEFLSSIDMLLHPARAEPFGMAVAEANAVGVPVLVSDQCGIASLITGQQGQVLSVDGACDKQKLSNIDKWVAACETLLYSPPNVHTLGLSWDQLADQHVELYESLVP